MSSGWSCSIFRNLLNEGDNYRTCILEFPVRCRSNGYSSLCQTLISYRPVEIVWKLVGNGVWRSTRKSNLLYTFADVHTRFDNSSCSIEMSLIDKDAKISSPPGRGLTGCKNAYGNCAKISDHTEKRESISTAQCMSRAATMGDTRNVLLITLQIITEVTTQVGLNPNYLKDEDLSWHKYSIFGRMRNRFKRHSSVGGKVPERGVDESSWHIEPD